MRYLTCRQVAEQYDLAVGTVRRAVWRGELRARKVGGWRIPEDEAAVWFERRWPERAATMREAVEH